MRNPIPVSSLIISLLSPLIPDEERQKKLKSLAKQIEQECKQLEEESQKEARKDE